MGLRDLFRREASGPGREEAAVADDHLVLRELEQAGADLTKPREVLHYLYFPTEEAADEAAEALRAAGYEVAVQPSAAGSASRNPWLALATIEAVVNEATVDQTRALMEGIAARGGGEYDGWEAAV